VGVELPRAGPISPKRIDADPQLALELAVCAQYKRFHSEFLALSQDDRDKAIWQFLRDRSTCPHCGTRPEEWDPDVGGHRGAYVADLAECEGCVVKLRGEAAAESELQAFRGMRVVLVRNQEVS
jgi:hypothetical protein